MSLDFLTERPIAHRGLHDRDRGIIENSMSAFKAALDGGFAIECDVQVTREGKAVVFHDELLDRVTDHTGKVRDRTAAELSAIKLSDGSDTIRTLEEHLDLVSGRVPMVVELKGIEGADAALVPAVAKALENYGGPVAIMSFDHWLTHQFQHAMPDLPRGLTAEGNDSKTGHHMNAWQTGNLQFVSYHVHDLPSQFVRIVREEDNAPIITWTVRTPDEVKLTNEFADQMTFEGFVPDLNGASAASND
ncbi:MAG: glycerophosphodiester phosphodiesterase [Pseudomonadota bacterium]